MEWAINTQKLLRIMDKMPNATEDQLKAEYIKQGGLIKEVETIEPKDEVITDLPKEETKKSVSKAVKEAVKKVVKKVTKK